MADGHLLSSRCEIEIRMGHATPNSTLITLSEVGHYPWFENPRLLEKALCYFVNEAISIQ